MRKNINVVVGIIKNTQQEILLGLRPNKTFMAGFWELPGGKVEAGETSETALHRELSEELNISVNQLNYRLNIQHQYPDRVANISVFDVLSYQGTPVGNEGQSIAWLDASNLKDKTNQYPLLPTMMRIINSINLKNEYWITPQEVNLTQIKQQLKNGIKQIQLRLKDTTTNYQRLLVDTQTLAQQYDAMVLLNHPQSLDNLSQNIHLTSSQLMDLTQRPISDKYLLGASVHNQTELIQAQKIGVDFAVLSPILTTTSHPNTNPLGWEGAKKLISTAQLPIYCLGGMCKKHLIQAQAIGAVGIAGISHL